MFNKNIYCYELRVYFDKSSVSTFYINNISKECLDVNYVFSSNSLKIVDCYVLTRHDVVEEVIEVEWLEMFEIKTSDIFYVTVTKVKKSDNA